MRNKIIILFLFLVLGTCLHFFCKKQTDGFQVSKIYGHCLYNPEWETTVSPEEQENLTSVLEKPFHYLGKGRRSFAFVSQDQKYVLKLISLSELSPPWWSQLSLAKALLPSRCEKEKNQKEVRKAQNFAGYKIGFEKLKEQTGTLFVHLNQTSTLHQTITFYDKIGIKHTLPADRLLFVVQKKADRFSPYFRNLLKQGKEEDAKKLLSEFAHLVKTRADLLIGDWDLFPRNLGILDGTWMTFDLDGLKKIAPERFSKKELMFLCSKHLIKKLNKKHKSLSQHLIAELERLSEETNSIEE